MKRLVIILSLVLVSLSAYAQTLNGIYIGRSTDGVRIYKFHESKEYWIYDGEGYLLEEGNLSIVDNVAEFRHSTSTYTVEIGQGSFRSPIFNFNQPDGFKNQMRLYMQLFDSDNNYINGYYWYGEEFADYPVPELRVREVIDVEAARAAYARPHKFGDIWEFQNRIYVLSDRGEYKLADLDGWIIEEGWWDAGMGRFYFGNTIHAVSRNATQYDFQWLDDYTILMIDPETDEELGTMTKIGRRREAANNGGK